MSRLRHLIIGLSQQRPVSNPGSFNLSLSFHRGTPFSYIIWGMTKVDYITSMIGLQVKDGKLERIWQEGVVT